MGLTDVLFISATLVWLSEFVLFKGKQQEQTTVSLTEKKSFIAILLTILFCIGLCLLFQQMNWTRINQPAMIWVGLTVYGCGIALRIWSMILLRGEFTRDVQTSKTMVLVSEVHTSTCVILYTPVCFYVCSVFPFTHKQLLELHYPSSLSHMYYPFVFV
ncbi:hypothetical protein JCM19046_766 [Bacillus sp. JCM 19046]|nr:hypothetical protein JCM19046_766 [Bacillus sp. JCM 19046]